MKYCPLCDKTYDDAVEVCATDGATLRLSRSKQDPLIDKVIKGRYRVLKKLGEGGMGAVYLADQFSINRKVALKILHPDFARDEDFVRRFRQEATLAASFSHQNVITVFDFDQADDGSLYIVMEHVDGHNLSDVIRANPMELGSALQLAIQIAGGLSAAHRAGVIHRDIKPENIMVVGGGKEVKLMDFGIARLRDRTTTTRLTQTGMIMGTPVYMAPEQIEGGELSERTDIYAFGIVLYEMLTGQVPFKASTPGAILVKHLHETPTPLSKIRKEIPSLVERIVIQALQKNPEKRQQSMDEVVEALKKAQRDAEQTGIGGTHSVAPQMAAVRRGFSAVASPFRKFFGKGVSDSNRSRSTDYTDSIHYQSTEKLGTETERSPSSPPTDNGEAVPPPAAFEPRDAINVDHPVTENQRQIFEAQVDRSAPPPQLHPAGAAEMGKGSAALSTESVPETVALTAPLRVPLPISDTPEILANADEIVREASIEQKAAPTALEPGLTNIADFPPPIDVPISAQQEALATKSLTEATPLKYQATVGAGMTELSASPGSQTISETAILAQPAETVSSSKKGWFVAAAVSIFVTVVGLIGLNLFRDSENAPVVKAEKPQMQGSPAQSSRTEPQAFEPDNNASQGTSAPPLVVALPDQTEKKIALSDVPPRKSEKPVPEQSKKTSGRPAVDTIKPDPSLAKRSEIFEREKVSKPVQKADPPAQTVGDLNEPIKKSSEPTTDNRVASLKPPEAPTPRIELKDLLIVTNRRELKVKERMTLTLKGRYSDGKETDMTTRVQWRSSDASVASVNSRGEIEALKEGKAQITATYEGVASPGLVLNVKANEESRKAEESSEQIKDLRRRLLR